MERQTTPSRAFPGRGPTWTRDPDRKLNLFQLVFLNFVFWLVLGSFVWMLAGCATAEPIIVRPEIVEVPVMAPFDCTLQCRAQPVNIVPESSDSPGEQRWLTVPGVGEQPEAPD